jgi:hypothetical protein
MLRKGTVQIPDGRQQCNFVCRSACNVQLKLCVCFMVYHGLKTCSEMEVELHAILSLTLDVASGQLNALATLPTGIQRLLPSGKEAVLCIWICMPVAT